ncbi:MAG: anaerobic ribonucleoside-triphosphate reductase activating protein [Candidatus Omnitrophica bacterium]|jgi:pyruvate formate lyase activating enzyme|nr:anaerobic ribonucleoside-triphosphate reductase activating protein [Candidatus Omnitrophota bacterium]
MFHTRPQALIKGFQESTLTDWDGNIACIIFLGRCNFRCGFCHSKMLVDGFDDIDTIPFERIAEYLSKKSGWIDGVVITGGEPCLHQQALIDLINQIKELRFPVKLDTNGSNPVLLEKIIKNGLIEYVAMDIKAPLRGKEYSRAVNVNVNIDDIILSKDIIINSGLEHEFRTTVVPGIIDKNNILDIAREIRKARKYCIQQFVPRDTLNPGFMSLKPYKAEDLYEMADSVKHYIKNTIVRPN